MLQFLPIVQVKKPRNLQGNGVRRMLTNEPTFYDGPLVKMILIVADNII